MFYSAARLDILAKRIAMLATDRVHTLAEAITGAIDYAPEVAGTLSGLMPHIVEKAIITSQNLPGDIAVSLAARFVNEFEAVVKMVSNAGGFSNPIKKTLFNVGFHTMFRREYDDLKPKINKLWDHAREEQENPIGYLAYLALKRVESSSGSNIESDQNISSSSNAVASLFKEIHAILQEA